jgi:hypothetical protein
MENVAVYFEAQGKEYGKGHDGEGETKRTGMSSIDAPPAARVTYHV